MIKITTSQLLKFAQKHAGQSFLTLKQARPFVVGVIDDQIVCYPESREIFWMETDEYVRQFNKHNSFKPSDYTKNLWSNSYFTSLVSAMVNGTKPFVAEATKLSESESPEPPSAKLEAKVRDLRRRVKLAPPIGQVSPKKVKVTSMQTVRDPAVKAWVLRVSGGKCSCCGNPAPFKDDDGLPFLEVHHVRPLVDGGPDTISNAVALCPNCHRACHHSRQRQKIVAKLYKSHARLKK
jgi:5-methylcytosine-specific restriction endonuclease McrA